jgi:hypothetical protein
MRLAKNDDMIRDSRRVDPISRSLACAFPCQRFADAFAAAAHDAGPT